MTENPQIPNLPTAKQDHFYRLRRDGLNIKESAKLAGLNYNYAYEVDRKLKEIHLAHPKNRKLASSALANILKGQPFGQVKEIKDSTVMQAVKEVYDRVNPKTNINVSESKETVINVNIDLSQYQDVPQSQDKGFTETDVTLTIPKED